MGTFSKTCKDYRSRPALLGKEEHDKYCQSIFQDCCTTKKQNASCSLAVKAAEAGRKLPRELDLHVRRGNSLVDDESKPELIPFVWADKFGEVISKGGFDAVIGNPPYVRQEELTEIKPYLEQNYEVYQGTADLFVYFFANTNEKLVRKFQEKFS